jgi:hypothetical protein
MVKAGAARSFARRNSMNINQCAGWALVIGAILLLVTVGRLDLLVILLPLSLLLAYGIGRSGHDKTRLTGDIKKG